MTAPDHPVPTSEPDPFAEMDREDGEARERDRKRAEYEACGQTVELREVRGRMVALGGARLTEPARKFWRRCDAERREQRAAYRGRQHRQLVPRRPCASRPRARGRRERRACRSCSAQRGKPRRSCGDDGDGEHHHQVDLQLLPRPAAVMKFALLDAERRCAEIEALR